MYPTPYTLCPTSSTFNPFNPILRPRISKSKPEPSTLNPATLHPQPQTLYPSYPPPSTPHPEPKSLRRRGWRLRGRRGIWCEFRGAMGTAVGEVRHALRHRRRQRHTVSSVTTFPGNFHGNVHGNFDSMERDGNKEMRRKCPREPLARLSTVDTHPQGLRERSLQTTGPLSI